jgi:hypothetical protein
MDMDMDMDGLEDEDDGRTSSMSRSSTFDHLSETESVHGQDLSEGGGARSAAGGGAADGDVSLASVAKDLGFEDHELTEMLKLPEEVFSSIMSQDDFGRNGDQLIRVEEPSTVLDAMVIGSGGSVPPGHPPGPPSVGVPPVGSSLPAPSSAPPDMIPVTEGNHSWADVESFLLSEGYRGSSFGDSVPGPSGCVQPSSAPPVGVVGAFVPPLPPPCPPPPYPSPATPAQPAISNCGTLSPANSNSSVLNPPGVSNPLTTSTSSAGNISRGEGRVAPPNSQQTKQQPTSTTPTSSSSR